MDILDELLFEAVPRTIEEEVSAAVVSADPIRPALKKISYTHDGMIDLIIANPAISQGRLASHFGYSASWVSTIIASDAFQSRLAERSQELVDPTIRASVKERFEGLVLRSMEILQEKLNKPADQIPDQLALRALEISTRAAGYGAKVDTPPISPVTVELHLEALGDNLTRLLQRRKVEVSENVLIEQIAGG